MNPVSRLAPAGLLLALLLPAAAADLPPAESVERFVTADHGVLRDGDRELRYVSVNLPDSLQLITHYDFDGDYNPTRYRWPDDYELRDSLRAVRQLGGRVVRTFMPTCHVGPDPRFHFDVAHTPVVPNEEGLRVLDRLLQYCHEEGIRLIIPLVNYHSRIRGDWTDYGADFWVVGSPGNLKFKDMVTQLLARRNQYTGVLYRDDPAILGWQTGNELVIGTDPDRRRWLHDFAAFIKGLDPRHLLIDGRNDPADVYPDYEEFAADPAIDAVSYHTYRNLPGTNSPTETLRRVSGRIARRKVLLVTEIAMYTSPVQLRELLDTIAGGAASGGNFWAMRFHNRDGGFYKHSDQGSQFEDLNWPGFPAAAGLLPAIATERELLDILSDRAWRIRGLERPAAAAPEAPAMLPAPDAGHLSWRGAAGAEDYVLERAEAPAGPWRALGGPVTDALIAYAPQYCDETVAPGHSYYYRVQARNAGGASPFSAPLGPIAPRAGWMVDNLFDLKHADAATRNLAIRLSYAHTAYLEDVGVAVRTDPAQPAELVYRLPGAVRTFTATIYQAGPAPRVLLGDPAGPRRAAAVTLHAYDGGRRVRVTAEVSDGDDRTITLELPAGGPADLAIGRVEVSYAFPPAR